MTSNSISLSTSPKEWHRGHPTDEANDKLIKLITATIKPNYEVLFDQDQWAHCDAKVVNPKTGETAVYLEGKVRFISLSGMSSMIIDHDKVPALLELSKEAPVFIVQQFNRHVYLYKFADKGRMSKYVTIAELDCPRSLRDQTRKTKTVYHLPFEHCWHYHLDGAESDLKVRHLSSPLYLRPEVMKLQAEAKEKERLRLASRAA